MDTKTKIGCVYGAVYVFVQLPIWLYIIYHVLSQIETSKFIWFLFGIYVVCSFGLSFIGEFLKRILAKENNPNA